VLVLGKPPPQTLLELVEHRSLASPTYLEVGATRAADFPAGYRHDRYQTMLGSGDAAFRSAVEGLHAWRAHQGAGVEVVPDAPVEDAATVVLAVHVGPVWAIAPCRVGYVIDEDDRWGFGYGTLPGHPEQGEEAFIVERDPSGLVTFRVAAFSRPADLLARVGDPVARVVQQRVIRRYLQALADFVRPPGST
jgi:uncharacterized protein (UPF0548 family)